MPVVEAVGVVTERGDDLEAVLITRHLDYSLPFRTLFARGGVPDLRHRLLDARRRAPRPPAPGGFFWGDCSLSNTLFRRDAGALTAYLVDAETGELHPTLSDGQRSHDLEIARRTSSGSSSTSTRSSASSSSPPRGHGERAGRALRPLWDELIHEESSAPTSGIASTTACAA